MERWKAGKTLRSIEIPIGIKKMKKITKELLSEIISEVLNDLAIEEGRAQYSKVKPWESGIVYFDKSANAAPLKPRMVRIKASVDVQGTLSLKKNYQQNMVQLEIMTDVIDNDGNYIKKPVYVKMPGKAIDPDEEGRFIDVEGWRLQKLGLTDKYGNLLDSRGNILASKKQQNKFSGA